MNPKDLNSFSNSHHPENSTDLSGSTHPIHSKHSTHSTYSTDSTHSKLNSLSTAFFYLSILLFIIGFNFSDVMVGNWYQQFMPNLGGRSITDVFFLDSLTGWSVTNATNQGTDTIFVLKTTNSGDNWVIQYRKIQTGGGFSGYFKIYFLNQNTGYTCDVLGVYKTTNGGTNWTTMNAPFNAYLDMSILSTDTIWIVTPDSFAGGVFFTSNGGASWQNQLDLGSQNPTKIYMYNMRIGFTSTGAGLYKTTNSGTNWSYISADGAFSDLFMIDSLTGWKANGFVKKTTDGGINWVNQPIPQGSNIFGNGAIRFMNKDNDTIWAVGESIIVSGSPPTRGLLFRTINGGNSWQYQLPDTSIHINRYLFGQFINNRIGWAYSFNPTGIHTTNGGNDTFFTPVIQENTHIPKEFILEQNYPNPFNPTTIIRFQITKLSDVKLKIFDIAGKEIITLVDEEKHAGTYEVDFNGSGYSSGVYFYRIEAEESNENKFVDSKKMVLIK